MKLHCDITLPASKSESNRVLMIAAYGGFTPDVQNLSESNDTFVLSKALAYINRGSAIVDIADSGTAARFLTTYLACHEGHWLLTGTKRMCQRPMASLVDALLSLGADIKYVEKEGFLPLQINGKPLAGGKVSIDMTQSSQFASSLLLAAPMWSQGLEMEMLGDLSSLPYLDMTLVMMQHFSARVERVGRTIIVKPTPYQSRPFAIEPDWSAASYWYEMAAFSEECEIKLRSLKVPELVEGPKGQHYLQGDTVIAEWMQQLGVGTFVDENDVVLKKIPFEKRPLCFDFSQHPDLYPTVAAICAGLNVKATFKGLDNLALKESDRVEAMQMELAKLVDRPIRFSAHNDHRIVMALAPLSMLVGPVSFDTPEAVKKSYPNFWQDASFLPVKR
jgi:3-phosphoshikimate 1-carboxyvinyltransferase